MRFEIALVAMKAGAKATRAKWEDEKRTVRIKDDSVVSRRKTMNGYFDETYHAQPKDLLAEDWEVMD